MPATALPEEQRWSRCAERCRRGRSTGMAARRWRPVRLDLALLTAFCMIVGVPVACFAESQQCAIGLTTPGRTWPSGDIVLEEGSDLSIMCILNRTFIDEKFRGKNASDLVIFKGKRQMEPEFITVINETAIRLDISKPPAQNDMYYCNLKLDRPKYDRDYEAVCLNKVVVGNKPQEVRNFECVSRNWENMTCMWEPPHNFVDTTYSITFQLPGRAGRRKVYPCPSDNQPPEIGKEKPRNTCYWDFSTNPIYRQPYEYYFFHLVGENVLGNWSTVYKFHHFANVIPAKPANLTVLCKTHNTALLHWSVAFPMQTFPPGLCHRVAIQNQWDDEDTWQIIDITDEPHNVKRYYNLTGLKYANTIYDVRVFIRSAVANSEDKWSNFSDITFRTLEQVPGRPPLTDVGSFEVWENNLNRDVYLYWQTIPSYLENGNNFRYVVSYVEENGRNVTMTLSPNETTRSYAKFRGLAHHSSYRFEIVARNNAGTNPHPARIYVPSRNSMPKEPIAFTKIAFEDGLYELSWKPPIDGYNAITNYTIFWCDSERDRPYQCQGYMQWIHVPRDVMVYNITVPEPRQVYQFAISANTERASSGMMWASCTVIHNKVVGKMKTVWINRIDSTMIEVGWKLDCSDRIGIVEGFKIYYCPIVSPYNLTCKDNTRFNTTIKADLNTIRGEVRGLKPYTTYMIAVAVLTKNGEGQYSDPLYNTTLEAAPSTPPRSIKISNITNTTMHVSWSEPEAMNGVLRYYDVYCNEKLHRVEEGTNVDLVDLMPNQNYSVRVQACTNGCSNLSDPVYAFTLIGAPQDMAAPIIRFINSSQVKLYWSKPRIPAGAVDYYQIKSYDGDIQNTTDEDISITIPDCKVDGERDKLYTFQVRAVNIAENKEHLFGNWSRKGEGNCFNNSPSYAVWVIFWVIGSVCGIVFVFLVAHCSKRAWIKCKAMQDVEVKLPPGLTPNMKLLQKSGDQHTRQSSADSSGCSSGQESVTSSLTSDSQVSSDSGADVDPMVSNNKLIIDASTNSTTTSSPAWESSSLRQRNVSGASKPSLDLAARWDPYVKIAKGSNELIVPTAPPTDSLSLARSTPNLTDNLGYAASHQSWSSTGYISMPSSEEMSSSPSPVPKENLNAGSYSVVGVIPKSPLRCKSEEKTNTLAKPSTDSENKTTTNPYVSLASLEQKTKDNPKQALNVMRGFDELSFDKSKETQLQQQQQSTDKLSRPYVQTGFLDSRKSPVAFDARRKPPGVSQAPASFFAQTSLADELVGKLAPTTDSKPYVTVASIADVTAKKPAVKIDKPALATAAHKPYITVSQMMADAKAMPPAVSTSAFQVTQQSKAPGVEVSSSASTEDQEKFGLYPSLDLGDKDDTSSTTSSPTSTITTRWQPSPSSPDRSLTDSLTSPVAPPPMKTTSSGYVTLPEQQQSKHQLPTKLAARLAKPQPTATTGQSDEQYSKVAVVPRH